MPVGPCSVLARIVLGAVTLVTAAVAQAQVTFGGDLNRPVNYGFDCGVAPGVGAFGERVLYPSNVGTCTWGSTSTAVASNGQPESFLVPNGDGTIVSVRIKVGQITGPMQVVVLRATRSAPSPNPRDPPPKGVVCCAEIGRSAVFTPAANAISTIAMNLPVKADIVPNPITNAYDFDVLGLSILAPGVPVPAHDTGNYTDLSGPAAGVYFPAIQPGQERADVFGTFGYQVLMEATWVPVQVPPPPGGGGGGGGGGTVTLVQPVASRQKNFLLLGLRCTQANPCVGALVVQNQGAAAGNVVARAAVTQQAGNDRRAAANRVITIAKGDFNIPPGQTQEVKAKLTRRGKRLIRKPVRPALFANLRIGGAESSAGSISLAP